MTFLVIVIFSWDFFCSLSAAYLHPCTSPLSDAAPELTSAYIHVPEPAVSKLEVAEQRFSALRLTLTTGYKDVKSKMSREQVGCSWSCFL